MAGVAQILAARLFVVRGVNAAWLVRLVARILALDVGRCALARQPAITQRMVEARAGTLALPAAVVRRTRIRRRKISALLRCLHHILRPILLLRLRNTLIVVVPRKQLLHTRPLQLLLML